MKLKKILYDILMYQIYKNPELSDSFLSQINLIENVEYEFT
jgi:hypothetical protein